MWETLNNSPLAAKVLIAVAIVVTLIYSRVHYLTNKLPSIPVREQPEVIATIKRLAVVVYIMVVIAVISFMVCLITIPIKWY